MILKVNMIRKQHGQLHQEVPSLLCRSKDRPLLRGVAPGIYSPWPSHPRTPPLIIALAPVPLSGKPQRGGDL